jgi:hypothetical protein
MSKAHFLQGIDFPLLHFGSSFTLIHAAITWREKLQSIISFSLSAALEVAPH